MTSRERIRTALNHNQPDRVPVDFGGTFETGIAVVASDLHREGTVFCKILYIVGFKHGNHVPDLLSLAVAHEFDAA